MRRAVFNWRTLGLLVSSILFGVLMLGMAVMFDSVPTEPLQITMKEDPPYLVSPINPSTITLFAKGGKEPYKWAVYDYGQRRELVGNTYDYEPEAMLTHKTVTLEVTDRAGTIATQRITLWQDEYADAPHPPSPPPYQP